MGMAHEQEIYFADDRIKIDYETDWNWISGEESVGISDGWELNEAVEVKITTEGGYEYEGPAVKKFLERLKKFCPEVAEEISSQTEFEEPDNLVKYRGRYMTQECAMERAIDRAESKYD